MSDDTSTNTGALFLVGTAAASGVARGIVSGLAGNDITVVIEPRDGARELTCDLLDAALRPGDPLLVGDQVLVWTSEAPNARGVVIGRVVTPAVESTTHGPAASAPRPRTIVLESGEALTLRVGDGSIEIRADGRILIKGTDLVSRATRMNRIKGGAVSIN